MNRAVPTGSPQHSGRAPHLPGRHMRSVALLGALAMVASSWTGVALADSPDGGDVAAMDQSSAQTTPAPQATEESAQTPQEVEADVAAGDEEGAGEVAGVTGGNGDATTGTPEQTSPDAVTIAPSSGLRAAGPDGGSAPYLYWTVKDGQGNLVPGATFKFEYYSWSIWWPGASQFGDCINSNCGDNALDRDSEAGEFLVNSWPKWTSGTNSIASGGSYRISQVDPPVGYQWVVAGTNAKTTNDSKWNNGTYNFGDFSVRKVTTAPTCLSGYVYGITDSGQMRQVDPNGNVTDLGSVAGSINLDMNGLGIGPNGQTVFAYSRSSNSSTASIYKYDIDTGNWKDTNVAVKSSDNKRDVVFVAGAVDLKTGVYYLGGFSGSGDTRVFRLWKYVPNGTAATYVGYVKTGGGGDSNGDIAFDASGNLFIVRGADTKTTIYSVTAVNLATANGSDTVPITSSASEPKSTSSSVNGVAFDGNGNGYLGSSNDVVRYEMPGWTPTAGVSVTNGLGGSNDLASCSSPPTITVKKEIVGGRVSQADQFKLTLSQGTTELGSATTAGNASGIQSQIIGPIPTVRGVELTFKEFGAGGAVLSNYASAYQCTVAYLNGTVTTLAEVSGTNGSVTIPQDGDAVTCVFRNSPLLANVTINKQMQNLNGSNAAPRTGWTVGATAVSSSGANIVTVPSDSSQKTDANGSASWKLRFNNSTDSATLKVSETEEANYSFVSGSCSVTSLTGATRDVALSGADVVDIPGIKPGDTVDCVYTNKPDSAELTLVKKVIGGTAQATEWTLEAQGSGNASGTSLSGQSGSTGVSMVVVPVGTYTITESSGPKGYAQTGFMCKAGSDELTSSSGSVEISKGQNVTCTITNTAVPGSVTWSKVDTAEPSNILDGSEWTLVGPSGEGSSQTKTITDCNTGTTCDSGSLDQDPTPGNFKLTGLAWGSYTLTEKKAPIGYVLDATDHSFVVGPEQGQVGVSGPENLGEFKNQQAEVPDLPLTGGMSTDAFLLGGGGLLALAGLGGFIHRRRSLRVAKA